MKKQHNNPSLYLTLLAFLLSVLFFGAGSTQVHTGADGELKNYLEFTGKSGMVYLPFDIGIYGFRDGQDTAEFTKSFDEPALPGGTVTLEFTITNLTSESLSNLTFTDDLNDVLSGLEAINLPIADVCGPGSVFSGTSELTLTGGQLAGNASCTFGVTLQVPADAEEGNYLNTTSDLSDDEGFIAGPAAAELIIVIPELAEFTKSFDEPALPGGTVTLEFTITNLTSESLTNMAFSDDLNDVLSGLEATDLPVNDVCGPGSVFSGTSELTLTGGQLVGDASCTFGVILQIPGDAEIGNHLNTTSNLTADGEVIAGPATAELMITDPELAEFTKSFDEPVLPGGEVTLEFNITNLTSESLTNLAFTDDLEAVLSGLEATGLPVNDVCGPGSIFSGTSELTLTGGQLGGNAFCTFGVTLQIPGDAEIGNYLNTTNNLTADGEVIAGSATAELTVVEPVFAADGRVLAGNLNGYTFTPADFSPSEDNASVIIQTLPVNGILELEGIGISADDEITAGDIDEKKLAYISTEDGHGVAFDSFNFTVKSAEGIESTETYTMTIDMGAASVELTEAAGESWRIMANPATGETFGDFLEPIWIQGVPGSDFPGEPDIANLYRFNNEETIYEWEPVSDMSNEIGRGQAFVVLVFEDDVFGTPGNFPKTLNTEEDWANLADEFEYTGLDFFDESPNEFDSSFFLLGNPHPISLDFCEMLGPAVNIASSIDVWDPAANGGNGDYINLNCTAGDVHIAPFQGFWVRTTNDNPELTIPETAYLESMEPGFFKENSPLKRGDERGVSHQTIALTVQTTDGPFTNRVQILFSEEGTMSLDHFDAPKLSPAGLATRWLSFYVLDDEGRGYAFRSLPAEVLAQAGLPTEALPLQESVSDRSDIEDAGLLIPLDIQTTEAGLFELNWELPPATAFNGSYWLRDNHNGEVVELINGDSYRFEVNDVVQKNSPLKRGDERGVSSESYHQERGEIFEGFRNTPPPSIIRGELPSLGGDSPEAGPRFELLITNLDVDGLSELGVLPEEVVLNQNYPNPFNPSTFISYEVPQQSNVRLNVYDMTGRRVVTLVDGQIPAGRHTVSFDAGHLSSGIYIYRLYTGDTVRTRKLTLIK